MATYRIGTGSFNLKDGAVGIGTESTHPWKFKDGDDNS